MLHRRVNSYVAAFLITLIGAAATYTITSVANTTVLRSYADLNPLERSSVRANAP